MEPEGETGAISGSFFFSFPPLRTFSRRHLSGAKLNRQVHLKASGQGWLVLERFRLLVITTLYHRCGQMPELMLRQKRKHWCAYAASIVTLMLYGSRS